VGVIVALEFAGKTDELACSAASCDACAAANPQASRSVRARCRNSSSARRTARRISTASKEGRETDQKIVESAEDLLQEGCLLEQGLAQ